MAEAAGLTVATIPEKQHTTVAAIYAAIVKRIERRRSRRLGASQVGHECRRASWYLFRWCDEESVDGRVLRLFRRGTLEEKQFIDDLRAAGMEVADFDPSTGQQFEFTAVGGHFVAKIDAGVLGLVEAPKTWHCVSFKTMKSDSFKAFVKNGAEKAEPKYWAQIHVEMELAGFERGAILTVNKDTDELHLERIKPDGTGARMIAKARAIITAPEPLERLSDKPEFYTCKWCNARAVCHEQRLPRPSCRTCVHATPELDGDARWSCAFHTKDLTIAEQRAGCPDHVFLPALVPLEFKHGDETGNFAEYMRGDGKALRNGTGDRDVYTSAELYAAQDAGFFVLDDATFNWLRINMGGRLEAARPEPPEEFDDYEQVKQALPLKSEQASAPF